jgi:methylated-DNA-[protein]-cysteine S-methyltransferase
LQEAAGQIEAYLRGALTSFSIPLKPSGTVFQSRIWALMQDIPYGETCTYNDLAQLAGSAARAVGTACGANPILLMIPCHRVVGKAGVTGYSGPGGVVTKQLLLDLEKAAPLRARSLSENGPAHAEPHAAEPIMSARRSA